MPRDDRQHEKKVQTMTALRALLAGIVDYAGLFPPAAVDMATAVRNYNSYLGDTDAWMLGRFVVPVARLSEFLAARNALASDRSAEGRLSAILGAGPDADLIRIREFNTVASGRAVVDSIEGKFATPEAIERFGRAARSEFAVFAEVPEGSDLEPLVAVIRRAGIHTKIRTGGVTSAAIPSPEAVVRFMRCCLDAGVAFKATAGLHHPLRAEYRLTYEPAAPTGVMYGYLNVFLAGALLADGLSDADAVRVLDERDPNAFTFAPGEVAWRGHVVNADLAERVRQRVAVSFGSCSFREPVDELHALTAA
jgi:hypothetical protein